MDDIEYNIGWYRWYWDSPIDGWIPTDERQYNYEYYFKKGDQSVDIQNLIDKINAPYFYKTITWEHIDKPPQWYIIDRYKYWEKIEENAKKMANLYKSLL